MAPRRGGGSSSGSGSGVSCEGCDEYVNYSASGISDPPTLAGIIFQIIGLIGFLVLFIISFRVRKIFEPESKKGKGTRYALTVTLAFWVIALLFGLVIDIVIGVVAVKGAFLIMYPFSNFFYFFANVLIVWTIWGFLFISFYKLRGPAGFASRLKTIGKCVVALLSILALAWVGLYSRYTKVRINSLSYSYGYDSLYYDGENVLRAMGGVNMAFNVVIAVVSIAFLGLAIKLFTEQRRSATRSRIPLALLALTAPFFFYSSIAGVGVTAWSLYGTYTSRTYVTLQWIQVIQAWTDYLPKILAVAGLLWAGMQPDWQLGSSPQRIDPNAPYQPYAVPSVPAGGYAAPMYAQQGQNWQQQQWHPGTGPQQGIFQQNQQPMGQYPQNAAYAPSSPSPISGQGYAPSGQYQYVQPNK